jgi:NitT/TauT family transport system ATP-binding protein
VIHVRGVTMRYGGSPEAGAQAVLALDNVSLEVAEEEVVCLLGPSGCGKSTLLNILAGFERPTAGETYLDGTPIRAPGPERAVGAQSPALFPWLSVADNVAFALKYRANGHAELEERTAEYVEAVGLAGFEHHYPYQLSGGMRQRVALARALIGDPGVLLLDEPFGALDAQMRLSMQELLQSVWYRYRPSVLFITHDVEEAIFLADRILVMTPRPGRIRAEFNVAIERPRGFEVLTSPHFVALKKEILSLLHSEFHNR